MTLESLLNGWLPAIGGMTAIWLAYMALMLRSQWKREHHLEAIRRQLTRIEVRQLHGGKK